MQMSVDHPQSRHNLGLGLLGENHWSLECGILLFDNPNILQCVTSLVSGADKAEHR